MDWQPIETAPKDGPILIYFQRRCWTKADGTLAELDAVRTVVERTEVAFCVDGDILESGTAHSVWEDWRGPEDFPTHWMPLPSPPNAAASRAIDPR